MIAAEPVETDIVLVGGGHAHVHAIAAIAMARPPGVRLTLVTRDLATPYSGMLPGVIAGVYDAAEAHIDLARLCAATGTRLIHAEANGLDRANKRVLLEDRAPVAYDLVSIDIGITPSLDAIAGARRHGIAVKPIGKFLSKFNELKEKARRAKGPRRFVVIGGGAGGVELALSIQSRLRADAVEAARNPDDLVFALVTDRRILPTHNARVQAIFRRVLAARGIRLIEGHGVTALKPGKVELDNGRAIESDAALITTQAAAPPWFAATGLTLRDGFIAVGPTLQSLNDPDVFAAGDCAELDETPREKAGVYAVRAGPPLARNLVARATGGTLRRWRPQGRHLALISTGERYAVASRGQLTLEGRWLWTVKDWIDRRWMQMYQDVDAMAARMRLSSRPAPAFAHSDDAMRCGGCAAKVGPGPLARALARLGPAAAKGVVIGLERPDDAAILRPPGAGRNVVQTVDFFRAFIDDPFVFGEVAANHALNDVFAMGGAPRFAVATTVVPPGRPQKVEEELFQMLAGARHCLDREKVALVGGHSSEGSEPAFGLTVTGDIAGKSAVTKAGLRPGNALILTRPVGTGILFAAHMRARTKAEWLEAVLAAMRQSNRAAAQILVDHGATAMTDVTGFGLAGHLGEMLAAGRVGATLDPARVPLYDGVRALAREGIASTLLPENLSLDSILSGNLDESMRAILFDPQTSGGLLAGVPADRTPDCLAALHAAGYAAAAQIGQVAARVPHARQVRISLASSAKP